MNFILHRQYSDENTPIRPEEAEQLIPQISTMGELNEYEALNILQAREWAFSTRTMKATNPLEEPSACCTRPLFIWRSGSNPFSIRCVALSRSPAR